MQPTANGEPVTDVLLDRMVQAIVEEVDPEQVILFGSRGRGDERENSDIDLIVVEAEPFGPQRSRHRELVRLYHAVAGFRVSADLLIETQHLSCPGDQARVWSHGARLSVAGAAVCNAYQTHNGEFDCVHEDAVVHTFTVPVAAALAWAEREGGVGGRDFLTSLALGVDVACSLGVASKSPFRFEALPDVTTLVDDLVPAPSTHPPPA